MDICQGFLLKRVRKESTKPNETRYLYKVLENKDITPYYMFLEKFDEFSLMHLYRTSMIA